MTLRGLKDSLENVTAMLAQAQLQAEVVTQAELTLIQLIGSSFAVSAFAGLAKLVYSKRDITYRSVAAAIMYTGACGSTTSLLMAGYGTHDPRLLLGVCGLVGIGAVSVVDVAERLFNGGGFRIELTQSGDEHDARDDL